MDLLMSPLILSVPAKMSLCTLSVFRDWNTRLGTSSLGAPKREIKSQNYLLKKPHPKVVLSK